MYGFYSFKFVEVCLWPRMWSAFLKVPRELRQMGILLLLKWSVEVNCTQLIDGDVEFSYVLTDFQPSGDSTFLFNHLIAVTAVWCSYDCCHDFLLIFGFQCFDYDVHKRGFLGIYSARGLLSFFLNLSIYLFQQNWKMFSCYFSPLFLRL